MSQASDLLAAIMDEDDAVFTELPKKRVLSFQIKKFVLQTLLDKAFTVVPARDVMPVLKCFQFQLEPGRLRVIASDLEMSLIASTALVDVEQPGTAVFPARKLLDIVKSAEDADCTIHVTGTTARIVIGRASWTLQLPGGDDYPRMPEITEAEFTQIERAVLSQAIIAVRYAASRDPNRANLNIIDVKDGRLTACDGTRIQQTRVPDFPISLRMPINAVDDLLSLLKISEVEQVYVGQSENKLIFRFGSDLFIVSKFFAQFPDIEAQMLRPALENRHSLDVERADLLAAIRRVKINSDSESSAIALHLEKQQLIISAKDKFGNTATQTIFCSFTGPDRTIVVNHKYLTDMINTHGDSTCHFKLGDDTRTRRSPLLLKAESGGVGVLQQMQSDWLGQ